MQDQDIQRIEAHLRRTFGAEALALKKRPKQKDSCEVYVGEEFVGECGAVAEGEGLEVPPARHRARAMQKATMPASARRTGPSGKASSAASAASP